MYLWDITLLAIYIIFLGVVPKCVTVALHMCGQFSLDINSDEITMNKWIKRGGAPGAFIPSSKFRGATALQTMYNFLWDTLYEVGVDPHRVLW